MARIQELYNKGLDVDNHKGGVTHLNPDILEHEVKWVLGSITTLLASLLTKLTEVMEFQLSYSKS